jgi:predicted nucleotidyltransferase
MIAEVTAGLRSLQPLRGVLAWYLLGSAVRGELRADSDLDLAALPFQGITLDHWQLLEWAAEAGALFGRVVDVGILDSNNLVYAKEALYHGILVQTSDAALCRTRAANLLSLYLTFQEDRKEVLNAYRA